MKLTTKAFAILSAAALTVVFTGCASKQESAKKSTPTQEKTNDKIVKKEVAKPIQQYDITEIKQAIDSVPYPPSCPRDLKHECEAAEKAYNENIAKVDKMLANVKPFEIAVNDISEGVKWDIKGSIPGLGWKDYSGDSRNTIIYISTDLDNGLLDSQRFQILGGCKTMYKPGRIKPISGHKGNILSYQSEFDKYGRSLFASGGEVRAANCD